MFAPSIKVDFDKLRGEEEPEEQPVVRKAKATPGSRSASSKRADDTTKKAD